MHHYNRVVRVHAKVGAALKHGQEERSQAREGAYLESMPMHTWNIEKPELFSMI